MLIRASVAALLLAAVAVVSGHEPAYAGRDCPEGTSLAETELGVICVVVTDPGDESDPVDPGSQDGTGEAPSGCFTNGGTKVPCATSLGEWWSGHQCYASPYEAPPGTPAWQGHTDGSLWACTKCEDVADAGDCILNVIWLAPGESPGPPDAGELATTAVCMLRLARADVHTAPQLPDPTYIGVENWLWVPESQWQILTRTVSAGGISVTVSATPEQIVWDLGAGTKTCYSAGRAWRVGMTDAATTTCSFTYDATSQGEDEGVFPITATIRYQVDWTCSGACSTASGSLGLVDAPAGTGAMRVLQRQTVVVR